VIKIVLRRITAADGTLLDLGELVGDHSTELIRLSRPRHEPVAVDAENVEPMEAIVDSNQVKSIGECLGLQVSLRLAERLKADRAASAERIVVRTDTFSHILVHQVEQPVDLCLLVAMSLQTIFYVALQHVDLVIVQALRRREFKYWRSFWELKETKDEG